jgi:hypothetical protein
VNAGRVSPLSGGAHDGALPLGATAGEPKSLDEKAG